MVNNEWTRHGQVKKKWTIQVQVLNMLWASIQSWTSLYKVVTKPWTSHEHVMNKSWASYAQGETAKSWTIHQQIHEQVINKECTNCEQVMKYLWMSHEQSWASHELVKIK